MGEKNGSFAPLVGVLTWSITGFGLLFTFCMGFLSLAVLISQLHRIKENLTLVDKLQILERQNQIQ